MTFTPFTVAIFALKLERSILLNNGIRTIPKTVIVTTRINISESLTVRMDPNITFSIIWEFAFAETKISREPPNAIDIDKKIPIRVSVDIFVLFLV